MNYVELARYIDDLKQGGFDTLRLRVQYYQKFTRPLFALTIALNELERVLIPFRDR